LLIMSISLSHFQFWSAYVGCTTQYKDAISKTWEQIDVVHRMVEANPATFEFVTSAQGPHLLVYKVWNVKIDFYHYRDRGCFQPGKNRKSHRSGRWTFHRQLVGRFADDVRHGCSLHDHDPFVRYSLVMGEIYLFIKH
jgi:hypothetical protein